MSDELGCVPLRVKSSLNFLESNFCCDGLLGSSSDAVASAQVESPFDVCNSSESKGFGELLSPRKLPRLLKS